MITITRLAAAALAAGLISATPLASAADTALVMCGTTCPNAGQALADETNERFLTPLYPGLTIVPVPITTPNEIWPLTGILRLVLTPTGDPELVEYAWPDQPLWKLTGLFDLTLDRSVAAGVVNLEEAMGGSDGHLIIYGYSQGAAVAEAEKRKLAAQYPDAESNPPDIDFVLHAPPSVPNGGLFARVPGLHIPILGATTTGPTPDDTQFDTVIIARQYDFFADFPMYPINVVADLNAILGALYIHGWPYEVSLAEDHPMLYQGTHGDTTYYIFRTEDLPLFGPLRQLGVPEELIDVVEPVAREVVELGYDRDIPPWQPTPFRLVPELDPAEVADNFSHAVNESVENAVELVTPPAPTPLVTQTLDTPPDEPDEPEPPKQPRIRDSFIARPGQRIERALDEGNRQLQQVVQRTGQALTQTSNIVKTQRDRVRTALSNLRPDRDDSESEPGEGD